MRGIQFIEIGFENIDHILIPIEYFKDFSMREITVSLKETISLDLEIETIVGRTEFTLYPSVEEASRSFGGDWIYPELWNTISERMKRNDIVDITLHDDDGNAACYCVAWESEPNYMYRNQYQRVTVDRGYCHVSIYRR